MPSINSLRALVLIAPMLVASPLLPDAIHAQVAVDIPDPGETVYEIRLGDGSVLFARIAELDEEQVVLVTVSGVRLEVDRSQLREIAPARGRVQDGDVWS
ncbi:MAG: hypothetical protein OXI12_04985, partial [Gammaproteobacteria bacterium]|nr:hypothetical protein [Gammaproteobacteria bacterium]